MVGIPTNNFIKTVNLFESGSDTPVYWKKLGCHFAVDIQLAKSSIRIFPWITNALMTGCGFTKYSLLFVLWFVTKLFVKSLCISFAQARDNEHNWQLMLILICKSRNWTKQQFKSFPSAMLMTKSYTSLSDHYILCKILHKPFELKLSGKFFKKKQERKISKFHIFSNILFSLILMGAICNQQWKISQQIIFEWRIWPTVQAESRFIARVNCTFLLHLCRGKYRDYLCVRKTNMCLLWTNAKKQSV